MKYAVLFTVFAGVALGVYLRRRWLRHAAWLADQHIQGAGGHVYRFRGLDERLQQEAEARRQRADQVKRQGLAIETRDDTRSKIHIVGR